MSRVNTLQGSGKALHFQSTLLKSHRFLQFYMQLIRVEDIKTANQFLQVAVIIYKKDPNWIRPLDKDINEIFDVKLNKAFRFGEAERWILKMTTVN